MPKHTTFFPAVFLKRVGLRALFYLLTSVLLSQGGAQAQNADAILGRWLSGNGKAHIEIFKDRGKYFGKLVWLKEPMNTEGKPKVDKNNPEPTMQDRPLMGLVNLWDFTFDGDDEYEDGKIYDPESGKTYSCIMTLKDPQTLHVRGYIGISLIGRTDTWTRVRN